jgi:hypothetical protein
MNAKRQNRKVAYTIVKKKTAFPSRIRTLKNLRSVSRDRKAMLNLKAQVVALKNRLLSPQPVRPKRKVIKRKRINSPDTLSLYETTCSPEQARIHEKVQQKVMLARLARFGGFTSPKVLAK